MLEFVKFTRFRLWWKFFSLRYCTLVNYLSFVLVRKNINDVEFSWYYIPFGVLKETNTVLCFYACNFIIEETIQMQIHLNFNQVKWKRSISNEICLDPMTWSLPEIQLNELSNTVFLQGVMILQKSVSYCDDRLHVFERNSLKVFVVRQLLDLEWKKQQHFFPFELFC